MKIKKTSHTKKIFFLLFAALLLGLLLFQLERTGSIDLFPDNATEDTTADEPFINYDPPTDEEQSAGDELKSGEDPPAQQPQPTDGSKVSASVIITDAGQYDNNIEVRAFIPDYYQDGTCTLTFTKGSQKLTKTAPAYADSSTTICTVPEITRSEFSSDGEWQVVVSYESADARGTSSPRNLTLN